MTSISCFVWQLLPFFLITFLLASDTSLAKPVVASTYAEHCGSVVPESLPTKRLFGASNSFLISNGLFSAGGHINTHLFPSSSTEFSNNDTQFSGSFHFQPGQVHRTHDDGTLQLEGNLVLIGSWFEFVLTGLLEEGVIDEFSNQTRVVFKLAGFWSEAKGKLCMVSTGEIQASEHNQVASPLSIVLKLEHPKVSKITTIIIRGSIESLNGDKMKTHFGPISLLAYAQSNYEYTMLEQAEKSCSHLPREESVGSDSTSICSNLVKFMQKETFTSNDLFDFLEFRFLSVDELVCLDDGTVHLSMVLSNESNPFSSFNGKSIFMGQLIVAEGVWEYQNNKLCLLACRLIGEANTSSSVVEDCSLSLSFWFPVTFSLKQRSAVVGRMWNASHVSTNNPNKIVSLYSVKSYKSFVVHGMKYEYTELDRARKNCQTKDLQPRKIKRYPNAQSQTDMMFQLSIKNLTNGKSAWGDAKQISIGDTYLGISGYRGLINDDNMYISGGKRVQSSSGLAYQNREVWDVGYAISYTFWDGSNYTVTVDISAEGIYNSTTGTLCLIGCQKPVFSHKHIDKILNSNEKMNYNNWDCTYFIQVQFPPLDSKQFKGAGKISSTRDDSDPLYFKPLEVTVSVMYVVSSVQDYVRMNTEIIFVIITHTILCICSYLQVRHVRKYSKIRPLMSITMLVVLTIGCMVTLILNSEAMHVPALVRTFLRSARWIDTKNTTARILTIVSLIINYHLFQLAWGSRSKEESRGNNSCSAEKKSLMFCVPLYVVGALIAWYVHSIFFKFHRKIFEELARYVGLLVDNFLLPQIIFNMFSEYKEKVLSPFFYFGVTVVRVVLPHIYNAYREWWYPQNFIDPKIYANHDGDYYSTILDVIIPFQGLLFALLVYLQQRFGGRCFLPKRFNGRTAGYATVCASNI